MSYLDVSLKAYLPDDEIEYFLDELEPLIELWLDNDEYSGNLTSIKYGSLAALRIDPGNIDEEDFVLDDESDFYSITFKATIEYLFEFTQDWTKAEVKSFLHSMEIELNFYSTLHIYDFSFKTTRREIRG